MLEQIHNDMFQVGNHIDYLARGNSEVVGFYFEAEDASQATGRYASIFSLG